MPTALPLVRRTEGRAPIDCPVCHRCLQNHPIQQQPTDGCDVCNCLPEDGSRVVGPEDVRFVNRGPAGNRCGASATEMGHSYNWICTREFGHPGSHAVHHTTTAVMFRWRQGNMPANTARSCGNCGMRRVPCQEESCRGRNRCSECCACNNVPFREQTRNMYLGDPSKRYPRYVGVEVECGKLPGAKTKGFKNVAVAADKYKFRIGTDGSISSFAKSTEISTTPARGEILHTQLQELGDALIKDELKANSSCGLHVHVDVRDYTIEHLMNFVYIWDRVENCLYRLVSPSRRTGTYSRPWGTKFKDAGVLNQKFSMEERERRLDAASYGSASEAQSYKNSRSKHNSRYHGMNLNAIPVHGTIEFRLHHGTVNPIKMRMWAAVCSALVEYAFQHTEVEIRELKGTNTEILEKIIGDEEVIAWTRARRLLFMNMERKQQGLVPLTRSAKPAAGSSRRKIPVADPGEVEMSEGATGS